MIIPYKVIYRIFTTLYDTITVSLYANFSQEMVSQLSYIMCWVLIELTNLFKVVSNYACANKLSKAFPIFDLSVYSEFQQNVN